MINHVASILATLLMIILTTHNTEAPTGLTIRVAGTDAASGLRAMSIVMTNRDNHPHQINGYPAISGYAPTGVYLDLAPTTGAPWQNRWLDQTMDLGNSGTIGITPWAAP